MNKRVSIASGAVVAAAVAYWLVSSRSDAYVTSRFGDLQATVWVGAGKGSAAVENGPEKVELFAVTDFKNPGMADIGWSTDRTRVAALACDIDGLGPVVGGYDLRAKRKLADSEARSVLRGSLTKRYETVAQGDAGFVLDPVNWACKSGTAYFEGQKARGLPVQLPAQIP